MEAGKKRIAKRRRRVSKVADEEPEEPEQKQEEIVPKTRRPAVRRSSAKATATKKQATKPATKKAKKVSSTPVPKGRATKKPKIAQDSPEDALENGNDDEEDEEEEEDIFAKTRGRKRKKIGDSDDEFAPEAKAVVKKPRNKGKEKVKEGEEDPENLDALLVDDDEKEEEAEDDGQRKDPERWVTVIEELKVRIEAMAANDDVEAYKKWESQKPDRYSVALNDDDLSDTLVNKVWVCDECTFRHTLLASKCEVCEAPNRMYQYYKKSRTDQKKESVYQKKLRQWESKKPELSPITMNPPFHIRARAHATDYYGAMVFVYDSDGEKVARVLDVTGYDRDVVTAGSKPLAEEAMGEPVQPLYGARRRKIKVTVKQEEAFFGRFQKMSRRELWRWTWKDNLQVDTRKDYYGPGVSLPRYIMTGTLELDVGCLELLVCKGMYVPQRGVLFYLANRDFKSHMLALAATADQNKPSRAGLLDETTLKKEKKDFCGVAGQKLCFDYEAAWTPKPMNIFQKQPSRIVAKLYGYQLKSLQWMKGVEDAVPKGFPYLSTYPWEKLETDIQFDCTAKRFVLPGTKPDDTLFAKGGILADEMGLGKTLIALGLMLANPSTPELRVQTEDRYHFSCKATLVLCPNHLCKQWVDEIKKYTKPELKVILLTTAPQHAKITYGDILAADVVVVSFQFIKNKAYFLKGCNSMFTSSETSERHQVIMTLGMELKRRRDLLKLRCPILDHFNWHRLIVDEGHEVLWDEGHSGKKNFYLSTIENYEANYRWIVSGTPMVYGANSLNGVLRFLRAKCASGRVLFGREHFLMNHQHPQLEQTLRAHLFWRNTKESIADEYNVPEVVEELRLLEQSAVEKAMYDTAKRSYNEERMRQICCHLQISDEEKRVLGNGMKTLEEIRTEMIAHKEKELEEIDVRLADMVADKRELELDLRRETAKSVIKALTQRIASAEEHIGRVKSERQNINASISYFKSIVPRVIQEITDPCPICFEEPMRELTITSCGHLYCWQCIESAVNAQARCPNCRADLDIAKLTKIAEEDEQTGLKEKLEIDHLIEKYGTKMAHLIHYLRELCQDPTNRIIIFSQWDRMLKRVADTLRENGINNVCCKGNVHQRNKAIDSFKSKPDCQVIMLSLAHAASGMNLVEATHIMMIDPVAGSREHARAIEAQAIGRAHRQGQTKQIVVVRWIMQNTIEHQLYSRNYADGEDS